jgi:nitrate reductase delta subunit
MTGSTLQIENRKRLRWKIENRKLHSSLADVLEYPDESWSRRVGAAMKALMNKENLAEPFTDFCWKTREMSLTELQELYTRTFDLNPTRALEIGYHLFGEDYKRGAFLANLRETESPFELGQEHQLPDYLPVLLRLLGESSDDELKDALVCYCMIPALEKMSAAFKDENPYRDLIKTVEIALKKFS